MEYLHGGRQHRSRLERKITGRVVGDKLSVVVTPEEGSGSAWGISKVRGLLSDDVDLEVGCSFWPEAPGANRCLFGSSA